LFVQTDWVLYRLLKSKDVILARIAEHVKSVNQIYASSEFIASNGQRFKGINFKVSRVMVSMLLIILGQKPYGSSLYFINLLLLLLYSS